MISKEVYSIYFGLRRIICNGFNQWSKSFNRRLYHINQILLGPHNLSPMLQGRIAYDDPVRASGDVVCDDGRPPGSLRVRIRVRGARFRRSGAT